MDRRSFLIGSVTSLSLLAGCVEDESTEFENNFPNSKTDLPPHSPSRPPNNDEEWDKDYLGDGLSVSSDNSFSDILHSVEDEHTNDLAVLSPSDYDGKSMFTVRVVSSEIESEDPDLFNVDYSEESVVIIEDGFGSSSVNPKWEAVKSYDGGLHIHGFYSKPLVQTQDIVSRVSVLLIDEPGVEKAGVSLTIDEETRVNFTTDDGIISL